MQCPWVLPQPDGSSLACKLQQHGVEVPHVHWTKVDEIQKQGTWVKPKAYQPDWTFDCSGLTIKTYCDDVLIAEARKEQFIQLFRVDHHQKAKPHTNIGVG